MRIGFKRLAGLIAGAAAALALGGAAPANPPQVKLWRLDCGELWVPNLDDYSDTHAYVGQSRRFVASCYLVRHGDSYMLWDTGLSKAEALGKTLTRGAEESEAMASSIVDQLARLGVKPDQISFIGISHYHFDHTGQAADFPQAKLLMGKGDLEVLRQPGSARAKPLQHWIGGGVVEDVSGDKDVFGDGSVVMLDLPGHTPGHHGLLVRLASGRAILLSGDVAHLRENLQTDGVPGFNFDRARSLASMDRFRKLGQNLKAVVIVQHDERDVGKLPAFPAAAE